MFRPQNLDHVHGQARSSHVRHRFDDTGRPLLGRTSHRHMRTHVCAGSPMWLLCSPTVSPASLFRTWSIQYNMLPRKYFPGPPGVWAISQVRGKEASNITWGAGPTAAQSLFRLPPFAVSTKRGLLQLNKHPITRRRASLKLRSHPAERRPIRQAFAVQLPVLILEA